jgi:hypothetical protein
LEENFSSPELDARVPVLAKLTNSYLVQVDCWAAVVGNVWVNVEVPHANLTEVAGMVLVKIDPGIVKQT